MMSDDGNDDQTSPTLPAAERSTTPNETEASNMSTSTNRAHPPPSRLESLPPFTPKKRSGIFGASSNLVNSIVGAGIIGIPYAMRQSGLIAGVFLLFLVSFLTDKSLRVIVEAASFHPVLRNRSVTTFEELMSYPFGRIGTFFILFNMFVMAYGAMVAYLLIIKDTVPTILGMGLEGGIERELILIITSLGIMVPLSMQRDMASLAFTSLLSVTADIILVGFVTSYSPVQESVSEVGGFGEFLKQDWINPTLFIGLGILSTAMACQHSCFIVYGSLQHNTRRRWAIVTGTSITIAAVLCAILGLAGYLGFLDETQGDVLNNFDPDSIVANAARALLAVTMFFTYPMESFVGRHVLVALLHGGDMDGPHEEGCLDRCVLNRRERMTLALYVMALIPALIFNDLGPVLSITGSLGGSCISYIAPGIVYLGVNGDAFLMYANELLGNRRRKKLRQSADDCAELPVAGDAEQIMASNGNDDNRSNDNSNLELPVAGSQVEIVTLPPGCKPLWWYLCLFPVWCSIAACGSAGMRKKLRENAEENDDNENFEEDEEHKVVLPTKGGFCTAVFFIMFGVVAAVAGLGTNIYVQLNNIDLAG